MTGWALIWQYVVYIALGLYFGLAVAITIGGFFDVKKMFRRLDAAHAAAADEAAARADQNRGDSRT